ncbi:hypothetical protein K3495_g9470 [Podosphaera aphanis]|nr:hypothetical protein K3495_g9470 [Podosphaera aphanis]
MQLNPDISALRPIAPANDRIKSLPSDLPHREYKGITSEIHCMLIEDIPTIEPIRDYVQVLRRVPRPSLWESLKGLSHYIGSYSLYENARWSVIASAFFRTWLSDEIIRQEFRVICRLVFQEEVLTDGINSVSDLVVMSLAKITKSNMQLMSASLSRNKRENFDECIKSSRRIVQKFFEAAAMKSDSRVSPKCN